MTFGAKRSREDGFGTRLCGHRCQSAYFASIRCDLARSQGAPTYKQYASGSSVLPKNVNLKFTLRLRTCRPPTRSSGMSTITVMRRASTIY